jgi:RimJ/RimL family protein N-acetyltransferase
MPYFKKMVGTLCYLSPLDPGDAARLTEWLNDRDVAESLAIAPQVISLPREREVLERLCREEASFAIVDSQTDSLLGVCGLTHVDHVNRTAELGIFIGEKSRWGKGYGTQATRLLLEFAFSLLNLNSVMLQVYDFNERAIRCYQKCGFSTVGRRREARLIAGRAHDVVVMDILAREFAGAGRTG